MPHDTDEWWLEKLEEDFVVKGTWPVSWKKVIHNRANWDVR
jgi:hypothetical protein